MKLQACGDEQPQDIGSQMTDMVMKQKFKKEK
jgi:hypothetical protein